MAQWCVYQTEKKVVKTMSYLTNTSFLTGGIEIEGHNELGNHRSINTWQQELNNAGFDFVQVKSDASPNVDFELVFPPMPLHMAGGAKDDIAAVLQFVESNGGKVSKRGCGLHVHVGNRAVKDISPRDFWRQSKQLMRDRNAYFMPADNQCHDIMPIALARDVIQRYATHHSDIDGILAPSRRAGDRSDVSRFCRCIRRVAFGGTHANEFANAESISHMNNILGGKFSAVSLNTWSTHQTMEFRQHQSTLDIAKLDAWCVLIDGMFRHSDNQRLDYVSPAETTVETPEMPYRNGSRIGVMWATIRRDGGATTQQIMNATGWSADTIRARVSEMRRSHGDAAIVCHTQQTFGHRYGSSNGEHDLNGYEVLQQVTTQVAGGVALYPENRIGVTSIWAGIDDLTFEYFNQRRASLS